jgi:hypothetical protein
LATTQTLPVHSVCFFDLFVEPNSNTMKSIRIGQFMLVMFLASCNVQEETSSALFIEPPLPDLNVSFSERLVEAGIGDTLIYETGTVIIFPPDAFLDRDGNAVTGQVDIRYREFRDPAEFYLSGIPMDYDSAGTSYVFESSGMFEMLAFQGGQPVFVNPEAKPELHLITDKNPDNSNLYVLDTVSKRWIYRGKTEFTDLSQQQTVTAKQPQGSALMLAEPPLKPQKALASTPVIRIDVEPGTLPELQAYHNMRFQIDPSVKNYNPGDTMELWTDVQLSPGKERGAYQVTFIGVRKRVSYAVRPVFEGKDYESALAVYEQQMKTYERLKNDRLAREKAYKEQLAAYQAEMARYDSINRRIDELNRLMEISNAATLERNAITEAKNKLVEERNKSIRAENDRRKEEVRSMMSVRDAAVKEQQRFIAEQKKAAQEELERINPGLAKANGLVNSIQIDGFGIWNCDFPYLSGGVHIYASFVNETGSPITVDHIALVVKGLNGIVRPTLTRFRVPVNTEFMIIGIYQGRFAYQDYTIFSKEEHNKDWEKHTFDMTIVDEEDNNPGFIKEIAGL